MSDETGPGGPKDLERELRVLRSKLERCKANQERLEELKDRSEVLLRSVIDDMEFAQRMVEERNRALERAAEELRVARQEALDASRAKSHFLAVMSHEIRTPLGGLIGLSELLEETPLDEQQAEIARLLVAAGDNLLQVVNDVLDVSKIEAGKLQLFEAEFAPRQCVEEVGDLLVPKTRGLPVELVIDIAPELPERVLGDATRLRQVLFNLVANAVKFTERGQVLVRACEVPGEDPEAATLRFEVRDSGPGIPHDKLASVFEAFSQADAIRGRGTGLGLAIVDRIVRALGGRVEAQSEEGRGSTFTVELTLPRLPGADPPPAWQGAGVRVVTALAARAQCDAVAAELAHRGLRAEACLDLAALRAKHAAGVAAGDPVAVVVIDEDAAGADLELLLAWRATVAAPPGVVLVTHLARLAAARRHLGEGVAACLTKPIKRAALHRAVGAALAGQLAPAAASGAAAAAATTATAPAVAAAAPQAPAAADAAAAAAVSAHHAPAERVGRILVVEDDPINRRLASRLLQKRGFTFDIAADGLQAVNACQRQLYALILMDCRMPVMDGFEASERIRGEGGPNAATPIVALTAGAIATERQKCLASGMTDVLAKPVRSATLYELIERFLAPS